MNAAFHRRAACDKRRGGHHALVRHRLAWFGLPRPVHAVPVSRTPVATPRTSQADSSVLAFRSAITNRPTTSPPFRTHFRSTTPATLSGNTHPRFLWRDFPQKPAAPYRLSRPDPSENLLPNSIRPRFRPAGAMLRPSFSRISTHVRFKSRARPAPAERKSSKANTATGSGKRCRRRAGNPAHSADGFRPVAYRCF